MNISTTGKDLIKGFEGFSENAYRDGNIWSIGYGFTYHEDGSPVGETDWMHKSYADYYFDIIIQKYEKPVNDYVTAKLTQSQFDALVSFTYNVGAGALKSSTLLKKVNANPNDPTIRDEFKKWVYAGGKVLNGLVKRREAEANLYFNNVAPSLNNTLLYAGLGVLGLAILNKQNA